MVSPETIDSELYYLSEGASMSTFVNRPMLHLLKQFLLKSYCDCSFIWVGTDCYFEVNSLRFSIFIFLSAITSVYCLRRPNMNFLDF